jgi:hypothetical protein
MKDSRPKSDKPAASDEVAAKNNFNKPKLRVKVIVTGLKASVFIYDLQTKAMTPVLPEEGHTATHARVFAFAKDLGRLLQCEVIGTRTVTKTTTTEENFDV